VTLGRRHRLHRGRIEHQIRRGDGIVDLARLELFIRQVRHTERPIAEVEVCGEPTFRRWTRPAFRKMFWRGSRARRWRRVVSPSAAPFTARQRRDTRRRVGREGRGSVSIGPG
jgi:hypothetical protein